MTGIPNDFRDPDDIDPPCDCVVKGTRVTYCAYHRDLGLMAIARIRLEHPWIVPQDRSR